MTSRWWPSESSHNEHVEIENVNTDESRLNLPTESWRSERVEIDNIHLINNYLSIIHSWHNAHVKIVNMNRLLDNRCLLNSRAQFPFIIDSVPAMFHAAAAEPSIGSRREFKGALNRHLGFPHAVKTVPSSWTNSKTPLSHCIHS